jgi:hypothetical protein
MTTYRAVGDIGNIALLIGTTIVSACLLFRFPDESYYDQAWLEKGFCVSNEDNVWLNSHSLAFYVGVFFTLCVWLIQRNYGKAVSPLAMAQIRGSMIAIFSHGAGHLYLGRNPAGMDMRFFLDKPLISGIAQCVNFFGFAGIFSGTMALASRQRILLTAAVATLGFSVLDIPPNLNFVYGQGVIYISSSLHFLSLPGELKDNPIYMLYSLFQLPVLVVGILESTRCDDLLKDLGGQGTYCLMQQLELEPWRCTLSICTRTAKRPLSPKCTKSIPPDMNQRLRASREQYFPHGSEIYYVAGC